MTLAAIGTLRAAQPSAGSTGLPAQAASRSAAAIVSPLADCKPHTRVAPKPSL
jgi:hypothetical protein